MSKKVTTDLKINFVSDYLTFLKERHIYATEVNVPVVDFFAVPPPAPYDAYQKLHLPFDLQTWIWTLLVFSVTFITIFVVYRMNVKVQELVFGKNVTTPSLNVLAHFFGLSQVVMPVRNFSRAILMFFILFSFMIRNLYQGMMCEFLQADMRSAKMVQSIEDIDKLGYKYFLDNPKSLTEAEDQRLFNFMEK